MSNSVTMITDVEDFFTKGCGRCDRFATPDCSARHWGTGLAALRALCLQAGLTEHVKWGHPCFMHAGRNIAIIGAFRGDFRLTFFKAALLKDPHSVLERQGPNTRHPDAIRFRSCEQVAPLTPVILGYLDEAKRYAEAGTEPPKDDAGLDLPDELREAMDADHELAEAFHALTPGRQKSHVLQIRGGKATATRVNRIDRLRPKILAGKGANEY
ncbi:MAG: YdeI/OmpD-associated family protein [Paracoccus sp. (in: a-proteobacteria)]